MAPRRSSRRAAAAATAAISTQTNPNAAASAANNNNKRRATATTRPAPASRKKATSTTNKRRTTTTTTTPSSPTKKIKLSGLQVAVDTSERLGVVDPEAGLPSTAVIVDLDNDNDDSSQEQEPADVMLVLVDPAQNMDKFFVLQLIDKSGGDDDYCVYTRWGRTGTVGQALQQDFPSLDDAFDCFCKKFQQKTGLAWSKRHSTTKPKPNKYRFIRQDFVRKQAGYETGAQWQYWVDDGVDGKPDGWYDYDAAGAVQAERLFTEHEQNPDLFQRWIDSGVWTYNVDLVAMTQTNVKHPNHTVRQIRRVPPEDEEDEDDEKKEEEEQDEPPKSRTRTKKAPAKKAPPAPQTPQRPTPAKKKAASVLVTPPPQPVASQKKKAATAPPVDPDVSLHGRDASEFTVVPFEDDATRYYDCVLNQCNISGGNNNNKYYRIQMLQEIGGRSSFFVWQKWGRVGEPGRASASALKGPYNSSEKARPEYAKKFRDKTKNEYDVTPEDFEAHHGKYTLIQIDNNVSAEDLPDLPDMPRQTKKNVEYEKCQLPSKTKSLVEVLFSKDMRDEALQSFNLDLRKLPLGVPSEQQIQNGIDILKQIEAKLNPSTTTTKGGSRSRPRASGVSASYEELSSQFYTAIPHSFGRSRPPAIRTTDALQSRFDMCNILLDMYATSETLRKLEQEENQQAQDEEITKMPNPVDRHYETLQADLTEVDPKSAEFKQIKDYFMKTRGQHSNSQLLDVWTVNRHSEEERFSKYDKLDNRRLLWHGTNIAVVAPILTSGLRIMPHSGGRVGAGIYLASMQEKSSQYTSGYGARFACMFLCEAALGKMHTVTQDGPHASGLKQAPKGFDSVHAVGCVTPPSWGTMTLDGNTVSIPTASGEAQPNVTSSFHHDEFLCYDEAQVRLRYVITVKE